MDIWADGKGIIKYKEWYSDYTELTYEERFDVEWEYFKEEMRTDYYKKALTLYTGKKRETLMKMLRPQQKFLEGSMKEIMTVMVSEKLETMLVAGWRS